MKHCWFMPIALLLPLQLNATDAVVVVRVATIAINPREITVLHLRPEFESTIRMPEEVTSVILGSPGEFKAEHSADEPNYVYVKPITKEPAQSNLLIAMKSGQHVTLNWQSQCPAETLAKPVPPSELFPWPQPILERSPAKVAYVGRCNRVVASCELTFSEVPSPSGRGLG